jgi:hypothetical protein
MDRNNPIIPERASVKYVVVATAIKAASISDFRQNPVEVKSACNMNGYIIARYSARTNETLKVDLTR